MDGNAKQCCPNVNAPTAVIVDRDQGSITSCCLVTATTPNTYISINSSWICCGATTRTLNYPNAACCGNQGLTYNMLNSSCCSWNTTGSTQNFAISVSGQGCCADAGPYWQNTSVCCNGKTTNNFAQSWNTTGCCNQTAYNSSSQYCCQGAPQVTDQQAYVFDNIAPNVPGSCCGQQGYNSAIQKCCNVNNSNVQPGFGVGCTQCCGLNPYTAVSYNTKTSLCCSGNVVPLPLTADTGDYACCGSNAFDTRNQYCCGNTTINVASGAWGTNGNTLGCCNGQPYDTRTSSCCPQADQCAYQFDSNNIRYLYCNSNPNGTINYNTNQLGCLTAPDEIITSLPGVCALQDDGLYVMLNNDATYVWQYVCIDPQCQICDITRFVASNNGTCYPWTGTALSGSYMASLNASSFNPSSTSGAGQMQVSVLLGLLFALALLFV
jgi:hypothetical protein